MAAAPPQAQAQVQSEYERMLQAQMQMYPEGFDDDEEAGQVD